MMLIATCSLMSGQMCILSVSGRTALRAVLTERARVDKAPEPRILSPQSCNGVLRTGNGGLKRTAQNER